MIGGSKLPAMAASAEPGRGGDIEQAGLIVDEIAARWVISDLWNSPFVPGDNGIGMRYGFCPIRSKNHRFSAQVWGTKRPASRRSFSFRGLEPYTGFH